jgi:hypothetical protein
MTKEEFITKRAVGRRQGRSVWVWFTAMLFISCCFAALYLIGFLCFLPFQGFLPEDRTHILIREASLLALVVFVAGGIYFTDWVWSKRSGFICRSCNKRYDAQVEQTGHCGHCGARVFDHDG